MSGQSLLRCALLAACAGLAACASAIALPPAPPPQTAAQLERWRAPPPLAAEPELALGEKLQRIALANGLHVTVVPRPESRSAVVRLWVPSAAEVHQGPLVLVAEALRAGTQLEAGQVLVNPKLGAASIDIDTGRTGTEFTWQVLPRAAQHAVQLLGQFLLHPLFEPAELRVRLRRELAALDSYSNSYARVGDIARGALPLLDAPDPKQEVRGLLELSRDQVQHLYRCSIRPERAELVVVGPVNVEAAFAWAKQAFGAWKVGAQSNETGCAPLALPAGKASAPLQQPVVQLLSGSLGEPRFWLSLPGPARESDDFPAFSLLAEVLKSRDGGSATALRQAGETNPIDVDVVSKFPGFSLLELRGQLEESSAAGSLERLLLELRGLEQQLSEADLDVARRRESAGYVHSLRSEWVLAAALMSELRAGHAPEAVYEWPSKLRALTLENLQQVALRWLSYAQPSIAVSSPPSKLGDSLGFPATVRRLRWTTSYHRD